MELDTAWVYNPKERMYGAITPEIQRIIPKKQVFALTNRIIGHINSPFHKTLPKSSLLMHWITVRFYEMGVNIQSENLVKKKTFYQGGGYMGFGKALYL